MVVGIGIVELFIFECRSLKEKRSVVRRLTSRAKNTFNISIAEVGENDNWKRCIVGFSTVGNDREYIDSKMNKIFRFIEDLHLADVVDTKMEIVSLSDMVGNDRGRESKFDDF